MRNFLLHCDIIWPYGKNHPSKTFVMQIGKVQNQYSRWRNGRIRLPKRRAFRRVRTARVRFGVRRRKRRRPRKKACNATLRALLRSANHKTRALARSVRNEKQPDDSAHSIESRERMCGYSQKRKTRLRVFKRRFVSRPWCSPQKNFVSPSLRTKAI